MEDQIINDLNDTRIKRPGISLGGKSAASAKRAGYSETGKTARPRQCPDKDIWVWTGYKLDDLNAAQMRVVDLINAWSTANLCGI